MAAVFGRTHSQSYLDALQRRTANKKTAVHYVYALIDPRDERVRYIGCSIDPYKRLVSHLYSGDLFNVREWSRELRPLGLIPRIVILDSGIGYLPTKRIEDRYIDEYDQFHGGLLNRQCAPRSARLRAEATP